MSTTLSAERKNPKLPAAAPRSRFDAWKLFHRTLMLGLLVAAGWGVAAELRCSCLQSYVISRLVSDFTFAPAAGPAKEPRFPEQGPYDERLGYAHIPAFSERLVRRQFTIEQQAEMSPSLRKFVDAGGYAPYREKSRAGLSVLGRGGEQLFERRYPERVYSEFSRIPPQVVKTLQFLEDRYLLDPRWPNRNPAVDWKRLPLAVVGRVAGKFDPSLKQGGASTLATQIEKFRHSRGGRTESAGEKFQQMMSATARAYLGGPDTTEWRRHLLTVYLNSTPLGSRAGYGEVIGLGDGLWAWYGTDWASANYILASQPHGGAALAEKARIYKQVLSLLLAQRRPSYYLLTDHAALEDITNTYLRLLASAGVIEPALRDAAQASRLAIRKEIQLPPPGSFVDRKAANAIRRELLSTFRVPNLYSLDRLDLTVSTTIDAEVQKKVSGVISQLDEPEKVQALGMVGERLLGNQDPGQVNYSVVIYERGADRNFLRVHADSLDEPFDINSGAKLILGSTAKLRTLVTYLHIIAKLHDRYAAQKPEELRAAGARALDPLSRWATSWLADAPDRSLRAMLHAAMERRYSANPRETFFTGGGAHVFHNFERKEDGMVPTVAWAFEHSVNLVFIRMMRDIVRYHVAGHDERTRHILTDANDPAREAYLRRFADREGQEYLNRFYSDYAELTPDEAFERLSNRVSPVPSRLSVVFRSVYPEASLPQFRDWIRRRLSKLSLDDSATDHLYRTYAADRFSLQDRGYLAGIHPLELWMVAYLQNHPGSSRSQVIEASATARQEAYAWLLKTRNRRKQDVRIRILLEADAFTHILQEWRSLGYPFGQLVPSLATAIGSSGDRPEALAQLMGIILNDGLRLPTTRIDRLHFAAGTPYETTAAFSPAKPERVLPVEVAQTVREALTGVVARGTAGRLRNVYVDANGNPLPVGGKTGTGDNRFEQYGRGGQVLSSKAIDRTATFVFFLGDRFFGTVTAYVRGEEADKFRFTSGLVVQLLKGLSEHLQPLVDGSSAAPKACGPVGRPCAVPQNAPQTAAKF